MSKFWTDIASPLSRQVACGGSLSFQRNRPPWNHYIKRKRSCQLLGFGCQFGFGSRFHSILLRVGEVVKRWSIAKLETKVTEWNLKKKGERGCPRCPCDWHSCEGRKSFRDWPGEGLHFSSCLALMWWQCAQLFEILICFRDSHVWRPVT